MAVSWKGERAALRVILACATLVSCGGPAVLQPGVTAPATAVASTAPATTTAPATASARTTVPASATPTGSARTTASASPTSSAAASVALPSAPPEPTLEPGVSVVVKGERRFRLAAGERRSFDPVELAREEGRTAPACAALVWTSTWSASEPLRSAFVQPTTRSEIGLGRWGTSTLGCSTLELRNDGSAPVDGRLVFTLASR